MSNITGRFRIDMRLTDKHILSIISNRVDHETQRARLTLPEIGREAGCHPNTVWHAVKRLENAGQIKRYNLGSAGTDYEVIQNA